MRTATLHRPLAASIVLSVCGLVLAGCGGSTTTTATATTATPTTAATVVTSPTTSGSASPGGTVGGPGTSPTGSPGTAGSTGSAPRPVVCDDLKTSVSVAYDTPVETMTELGGICTATLRGGDRVELLWNRFASNETSFATTTRGLTRVDVGGTWHAAGGFDDLGARVKALLDGKGTWELSLTPEYTASRAPDQSDVSKLIRLAEVLIGHGQPS